MKKLLLALAVLGMTAVSVEANTNTRPRAKTVKVENTEVVNTKTVSAEVVNAQEVNSEADSKLYKTSRSRVMWKSAHGNMWVDRHSVRKLN